MVAVGGRSLSRARDVADLPEPDSPTRPTVSLGAMSKEIPWTASCPENAMRRSRTASSGAEADDSGAIQPRIADVRARVERAVGAWSRVATSNRHEWSDSAVSAGPVAGVCGLDAHGGAGELAGPGAACGCIGIHAAVVLGTPCHGPAGVYGAGDPGGARGGSDGADSRGVGRHYAAALFALQGCGGLSHAL